MRLFTRNRTSDSEDEIWLVEHPSVFTQGLAGLPEHVLAAGEIPVVATERGGQVTYHGPGQVLAYLLLDLRRNGLMVRALVDTMESAVIATLAGYGLPAMRKPGAPGVYMAIEHGAAPPGEVAAPGQTAAPLAGAKISALGIKVARGCSYHGLALNVAMDLEPFSRINPCGYPGLEVTDMLAELERQPGSARPHRGPAASLVASVASQLAEELALRLQR